MIFSTDELNFEAPAGDVVINASNSAYISIIYTLCVSQLHISLSFKILNTV